MSHPEHAPVFRPLHEPGAFLILPNAWDAGSARVIEDCGAPAIATSRRPPGAERDLQSLMSDG